MQELTRIQAEIAEQGDPDRDVDRLWWAEVAGGLQVEYTGSPFGEAYEQLLAALAGPPLAESLCWLSFRGVDDGDNGTQNWNLEPLLEAPGFPRLAVLRVELGKPGDHNRSIVGESYGEAGVLAGILALAPELRELTSPSAPDGAFFRVGRRPLESLNVDAGYDTQNFIKNLASCPSFPDLRVLEFGEYNETYMDDWRQQCTPFADYRDLFESRAFDPIKMFVWRNPVCTAEEIALLQSLRPNLPMKIVSTTSAYVR